MKSLVVSIFLTLFAVSSSAENDFQFEGVWCGKWDDIYKTCFTISKIKNAYKVLYKWEENQGSGYQKKEIPGIQMNANTIDFKGKIFIVNLKERNKATAVGIFKHHSRTALLEKEVNL